MRASTTPSLLGAALCLWAAAAQPAAAREMLSAAVGLSDVQPASGAEAEAFLREVTQTRGGEPFARVFAGKVPGRAVAVIPLAQLGDPRGRSGAEIRRMVEAQVDFALPHDTATTAELWRQSVAAYESFGAAFVRDLPGGRSYCVALVGRPAGSRERLVSAIAAGLPQAAPINPDFPVSENDIQRFLAYHEAGGHCGDPRLQPTTGMDVTAEDAYNHNLAELRADVFATLAVAHDDGDTRVPRAMLALRRAYSLQAAAAPFCNALVNYGAVYHTAPGIVAAIDWAEAALAGPDSDGGNLRNMGYADLLAAADRLAAEVKPSFPAFQGFMRHANELRELVDSADPATIAAEAARAGAFDNADQVWLVRGVAAIRRIFAAGPGTVSGLRVRCPPSPQVTSRARDPAVAAPGAVAPAGGAGLGG